jgi:type IV pilus assembly protein PilM
MRMFGAGIKKQFLGVDIGESAVKLVQITHHKNSQIVTNVAIEPLHRGLFVEGQIVDAEQIGTLIRHTMTQHKFTARQAVACVNFADIISKRLMVRGDLRAQELEQWIEFEIEKFVPFPVSELNLDYQVAQETEQDDEEREVLVTACRRATISKIQSCLEFAELEPLCIDVAYNAMERASRLVIQGMTGGGVNGLTALIDVGTSSMRFYVYQGEEMVYQREEPFGARMLIDDIVSEYSMDEDKALQAIYNKQLPPSYKTKVLKPYVKPMVKEIERGMLAFEASGVEGEIDRVLLAGGSARVGGLEHILEKRIKKEVKTLSTLSLLPASKKISSQRLQSQAPQMAIACGLAMWVPGGVL